MMVTSDQINEIATALAKAQGEMGGAVKDSANPFFKSKYADLASVWDACRGPLSKNGLSILQSPCTDATEAGIRVSVETLLLHSSGQWIRGVVTVSAKEDSPQAVGSCISYLKRYALQSFAGVAPEDDDGEAAQGRGRLPHAASAAVQASPKPPAGYAEWLDGLRDDAMDGTARLEASWKKSAPELRQYLTSVNPKLWESIKAAAAKVPVTA